MSAIKRCFSKCLVTGNTYTGGFIGSADAGVAEDCYYDHDIAPISDSHATAKTTSEMKSQASFPGWNFIDTWKIGVFAGGEKKSLTGSDGSYEVPVKDGTVMVYLELDPSEGYPYLQFETKKQITKSGRTRCDWYVRGAMPEYELWEFGNIFDDDEFDESYTPQKIDGVAQPAFVAQGSMAYHALYIDSDGYIYGWLFNDEWQLGLGEGADEWYRHPQKIGSDKWIHAACGQSGSIAVKDDGTLWFWGFGTRGDGSDEGSRVPLQISASEWIYTAAGIYFYVAIRSDGKAFSWGDNTSGALGRGLSDPSVYDTMGEISGDHTLTKVACGQHHSLAIDDSGKLWSWGSGFAGQLGLDSTTSYNTPQLVDSDEWTDIACGRYHSLAIKDGKLYSFGDNSNGQLGTNDTSRRYVPTLVAETQRDGKSWIAVSAAYRISFALRSDGVLFGCGTNSYGELGLGDFDDRDEFTEIDSGWSQLASIIYSSNGIKAM